MDNTQQTVTVQDNNAIKTDINQEYANKPHGGSKLVYAMVLLTLGLLIVFTILMFVFFILYNKPPVHNIILQNSTNATIFVNVAINPSVHSNSFVTLTLDPSQMKTIYATPGVNTYFQAYSDIIDAKSVPATNVILELAGSGYNRQAQLTIENDIFNVDKNNFTQDRYAVSLQQGFNMIANITVTTNGNFSSGTGDFYCKSPSFTGAITQQICPNLLQVTGHSGTYVACGTPCFALPNNKEQYCCAAPGACQGTSGCQSLWPNKSYYEVFATACPNCLITNCDKANYFCQSEGGLTNYSINFVSK